MERQVIFRDYMEQQAQDHLDLQDYARESLDHLVLDAVTDERKFAGFTVSKTGQTEIQITAGRFYDILGAVYARNTTLTQSMITYLAAVSKRYVAITVYGSETETDVEERDFLVDVNTGRTEPNAVATTSSRDAVLAFTTGTETADPVPPSIPVGHCAIAYILLDTTQVVSITMLTDNKVTSTGNLDIRTDDLETFKDQVGPKISSLASDIAALQSRLAGLSPSPNVQRISEDLARVKESLRYPTTASDYGADFYLNKSQSDSDNELAQGYDALVEEGIRFPDANADEFELSLFSANDPNASYTNGLLLPKFTEVVRLATSYATTAPSDLGIAQYGYQTVEMKQGYMSRSRLRFGGSRLVCSNATQWGTWDPNIPFNWSGQPVTWSNPAQNLYTDAEWSSVEMDVMGQEWWDFSYAVHEVVRYDRWFYDTWREPYMYAQTIDHSIQGAMVAQTFLASNDMWCTKASVFITAKGANEDIHVSICQITAGVPDLTKLVVKVAYAQASIVVGWNDIALPPTFLQKGTKYAIVLVSNANHKIGMVSGQTYLDGTFFYSTDGAYYQGDLTKDMMFKIWAARFESSQVTIEFAPINLDGGFRYVDILCEMWQPQSTSLVWEMRPSGAGLWIPLTRDNSATLLATAPPLAQFRARFDGTHDMHAAVKLIGSRVHVSRPKLALKHVSTQLLFATPADEVHVKCLLEGFDETPHEHSCYLLLESGLVQFNPTSIITRLLQPGTKQYEREYIFGLSGNVSSITIVQIGTTNSAQDTFHVAERTYFSQ